MVLNKLFLYGLFVAAVAFVLFMLFGCADRRDMSRREVLDIMKLEKELRR